MGQSAVRPTLGRMGSGPAVGLGARPDCRRPRPCSRRWGSADAVAVRDGTRTLIASDPVEVVVASGTDALTALGRLTPGWWAGFLAYDLGRTIERVTPRTPPTALPDLGFARFEARLVIDPRGCSHRGRSWE